MIFFPLAKNTCLLMKMNHKEDFIMFELYAIGIGVIAIIGLIGAEFKNEIIGFINEKLEED